jgi:phosphoenolpyruvate carboxylase
MIRKNPSGHLPAVHDFDAPLLDQGASDSPMYADIRLLGRVQGDTIRACEGGQAFALIESIRQAALRLHRGDDPDQGRVGLSLPEPWHG